MKTYKCTPIKDEKGLVDIDITEIYNVEDLEERYPAGWRQWRIGAVIPEHDIVFDEEGFAYNVNLLYRK